MTLFELAIRVLGRRPARALEAAAADPRRAQEEHLARTIRRNADTAFGRDHGFSEIRCIADYRKRVPIRDFEGLRAYADRAAAGEARVLTAEAPGVFASTSGTTGKPKLIPVTAATRAELNATSRVWLLRALEDHPGILDGRILTMVGPPVEGRTSGDLPYTSMAAITYWSLPAALRRRFALPEAAMTIEDQGLRNYVCARLALEEEISLCTLPNPSTLLKLARTGEEVAERAIGAIRDGTLGHEGLEKLPEDRRFESWDGLESRDGSSVRSRGTARDAARLAEIEARLRPNPARARVLEEVVKRTGALRPRDAWPGLKLIGCWLGGSAGIQAKLLREHYGDVPMRDLGLRASEAMMTVPIGDGSPAGLLAVNVNSTEFIPEDEIESKDPPVLGAHELALGGRYYIILTTSGGLYRYDINDIVEVRDFYRRTPLVAFVRKGRDMTNLTGEKLHAGQVIEAIAVCERRGGLRTVQFRSVACVDAMRYDLLVELHGGGDVAPEDLRGFLRGFDAALGRFNSEYRSKRTSKRLHPPRLCRMRAGWAERQQQRDVAAGKRDTQYKWQVLTDRWDAESEAEVLERLELLREE